MVTIYDPLGEANVIIGNPPADQSALVASLQAQIATVTASNAALTAANASLAGKIANAQPHAAAVVTALQ